MLLALTVGCAGDDSSSDDECKTDARTTVCAAERAAASCITDPAHSTACSGASFQELFTAMGRVFCVDTH